MDYVISSPFKRCLQTSAGLVKSLPGLQEGHWLVDWQLGEVGEVALARHGGERGGWESVGPCSLVTPRGSSGWLLLTAQGPDPNPAGTRFCSGCECVVTYVGECAQHAYATKLRQGKHLVQNLTVWST